MRFLKWRSSPLSLEGTDNRPLVYVGKKLEFCFLSQFFFFVSEKELVGGAHAPNPPHPSPPPDFKPYIGNLKK